MQLFHYKYFNNLIQPTSYYSKYKQEWSKHPELASPLDNMVNKLCSDIVKIHYNSAYRGKVNLDNIKMGKQLAEYLSAGDDSKALENLSNEGFALATYKLAAESLTFFDSTGGTAEVKVSMYEKADALYKKAKGQENESDNEYIKQLLDKSRTLGLLTEKQETLLDSKKEAIDKLAKCVEDYNYYCRLIREKNERLDKLQADKNRVTRNLATCKKQYGARYVDALERFDILPGTPYKLLQEYQQGGRLYRYIPFSYYNTGESRCIKLYKGSQGMNYTNYSVVMNDYYYYNIQVSNGKVTWVGKRRLTD